MANLKPCPFCGKQVTMKKLPLWHSYQDVNGRTITRGYYGDYEYVVKCENPKCRCTVNLGANNTIYNKSQKAKLNAINAWNRRAKSINEDLII